jgi:hypothetical protein
MSKEEMYASAQAIHDADMAKINSKHDPVNSPKHYEVLHNVEVMDIIMAQLTAEEYNGWLKGNALKYILRADKKGKPAEDREKAVWMLNRVEEL